MRELLANGSTNCGVKGSDAAVRCAHVRLGVQLQPTISSWTVRSASHPGLEEAPPSAAVRNFSHWVKARTSVFALGNIRIPYGMAGDRSAVLRVSD